jgi:hypothetical protein
MDVILMGVTQTLGTLSRNCERLAAAQYSNSLKPERFLKKAPLLGGREGTCAGDGEAG